MAGVAAVLLPLALAAACQRAPEQQAPPQQQAPQQAPEQFTSIPTACATVTRATLDRIVPGGRAEPTPDTVDSPGSGFDACVWTNNPDPVNNPVGIGNLIELDVELLRFSTPAEAAANLAEVRGRMAPHQELGDLGDAAVLEDSQDSDSPLDTRYVRAVRGNVYVVVAYQNGATPPDLDAERAVEATRDVLASLG